MAVQDSLAGELAIDKPPGDYGDIAPCGFDRDLRPQLLRCDQIGEQRETDAGPLDAHQFVEQGKPVEPHPAGRKEITALERRASAGALPRVDPTKRSRKLVWRTLAP